MPNKLQQEYLNLVKTKAISLDNQQLEIIKQLEELQHLLERNQKRLFKRSYKNSGLYIFGDVGRGKSLVMDLFYSITKCKKKRVHFHEFMSDIHRELHELRKTKPGLEDPLNFIAKSYSKKYQLLCFDEFQVTDVADAMILERLFRSLFDYKVIIVTTSNRHPDNLYKGGLQRDKYLEFVQYIIEKMDITELKGKEDYRSIQISNMEQTYFYPLSQDNHFKIINLFEELTSHSTASLHIVKNLGRDLAIAQAASSTAIIDFDEFCKKPYSASDYQAIAKEFSTIFLINIPVIEDRNEAKRFVNFIDVMYDKHINLIFLAEVEAKNIYPKGDGKFEFERTISRITEMQSSRYIEAA